MLIRINSQKDLQEVAAKYSEYFILFFWGSFSEAAQRAFAELKKFARDYKDIPVAVIDVEKAKNIPEEYGVDSVPLVLAVKNGKETERFEGVESAAFYATNLAGLAPKRMAKFSGKKGKKPLRVTVYSSPACPACGLVKSYLQKNGVSFRSVDISRDERAAREIVRRSGQQAVPQTDINGRIVVGFDRGKLAALLGIKHETERT